MPKDTLDLDDVVKAINEVKTSHEKFKEAAEERQKEFLTKGTVDPLIDAKLEKLNEDMNKHQETIDAMAASMQRKHIQFNGEQIDLDELDQKALAWAKSCARRRGESLEEYKHEQVADYRKGFRAYMRKNEALLSADEQKALSVGSDPDGGYTVSPDMSGRLVKKQFDTSPMRQYASVQVISTDALEGVYDLDEVSTGWVSETGSRPQTSTAQLGVWRIPVHEAYAMPAATQKLLDDSAIDIEGWLMDKVADKLTRTENESFVNGTEVYEPRGFLTYANGTTLPGTIEQTNSGANGAFVAAPNSGDILIQVQAKLKSAYKANAAWFMNRVTLGGVRLLKDSNGQFLWQPSIQAGNPATLLGDPVALTFEDMPTYTTTGALAIAYGDMAATYQIVDRLGLRVLRDPFTAKPYILFYTTKRVGGDVVNFESLKLINFSA